MEQFTNPINSTELNHVVSDCACFNLRKASRVVTQHFDELLKPSGLLATQFTILVAVKMASPCTINELAEGLVMDRTTLTRNLKPLEREQWLTIDLGQDRRTRLINLTSKGQSALDKAFPLWLKAQASVEESMGQKRWDTLRSHLVDVTALIR